MSSGARQVSGPHRLHPWLTGIRMELTSQWHISAWCLWVPGWLTQRSWVGSQGRSVRGLTRMDRSMDRPAGLDSMRTEAAHALHTCMT